MRWMALVGALATVTAAGAIETSSPAALLTEPPSLDIALLPASHRPYREIGTLSANDENAFRTLVAADRVSGLAQVVNLAASSRFEEQWAHVTALDLWIEIGINEVTSASDAEVEIDVDYLRSIVALFPDVHVVHFHPARFYPLVLPAELPAERMAGDVAAIGYALPSPTDVLSSIRLAEILRTDNPAAKVAFSVVSPHGVVTYGATEPGIATITYEGNNPRAATARSIATRAAIRRLPFNITRTIDALGGPSIGAVIADLCAQASDENYTLGYAPLLPDLFDP